MRMVSSRGTTADIPHQSMKRQSKTFPRHPSNRGRSKVAVRKVHGVRFRNHKSRGPGDCGKFDVIVDYTDSQNIAHRQTLVIGQRSSKRNDNDYPHHQSTARLREYKRRHSKREDWEITGANTKGFWARHMLWSEKTPARILKHLQQILQIENLYFPPDVAQQLRRPWKLCTPGSK